MRLVFGLVLVLGLGLAGFAVYMAQDRFSQYQSAIEAQRIALSSNVKLVDVIVANKNFSYGEKIRADDIIVVKFPESALPKGIFSKPEQIFSKGPDVLRTVLRPIEKFEAIMAVKITEPGDDAGPSSRLGAGRRAFALRVDVASGVSGFLRPGDKVDIYWTGTSEGVEITQLIQASVLLLAVDQTADTNRSAPTIARTITVDVTAQEAGNLALAQSTGALQLSLVGSEDTTLSSTVQSTKDELLGVVRTEKTATAKKRVCTITTRKGATVIEIPIPCRDE